MGMGVAAGLAAERRLRGRAPVGLNFERRPREGARGWPHGRPHHVPLRDARGRQRIPLRLRCRCRCEHDALLAPPSARPTGARADPHGAGAQRRRCRTRTMRSASSRRARSTRPRWTSAPPRAGDPLEHEPVPEDRKRRRAPPESGTSPHRAAPRAAGRPSRPLPEGRRHDRAALPGPLQVAGRRETPSRTRCSPSRAGRRHAAHPRTRAIRGPRGDLAVDRPPGEQRRALRGHREAFNRQLGKLIVRHRPTAPRRSTLHVARPARVPDEAPQRLPRGLRRLRPGAARRVRSNSRRIARTGARARACRPLRHLRDASTGRRSSAPASWPTG
jgi:hypothetical protein